MDKLAEDTQRTIRALETLSERTTDSLEAIDELLDQLFQQKIDLAGSQYSHTAPAYQQAAQSMAGAANKAERAVKNPGAIPAVIPAVADAIAKLARLLDSVAHSI